MVALLSWFPFYCGAVLSGLDDDHISAHSWRGESMSSLSDIMRLRLQATLRIGVGWTLSRQELDHDHSKLIYRYCRG
jgi:hypothetical protein